MAWRRSESITLRALEGVKAGYFKYWAVDVKKTVSSLRCESEGCRAQEQTQAVAFKLEAVGGRRCEWERRLCAECRECWKELVVRAAKGPVPFGDIGTSEADSSLILLPQLPEPKSERYKVRGFCPECGRSVSQTFRSRVSEGKCAEELWCSNCDCSVDRAEGEEARKQKIRDWAGDEWSKEHGY